MKRFKNILAVVNDAVGNDNTLVQAAALAVRNGAKLTVVEVVSDLDMPLSFIAERKKHLRRLTTSIQQNGIELNTDVVKGTPFLEVIRKVVREKIDLVMMAADGGGGYKDLFFGGTSMHLMRKCPCPVWITKPGDHDSYHRVMAAIEPDLKTGGKNKLNINIIDLAGSLALLNGCDLHIAQAWEVGGNDRNTLCSEAPDNVISEILRKHEQMHRQPIESLLRNYGMSDINCIVHLLRGAPEFVLPQLVETMGIDLLVMGTVSRTGIAGFIIGNTAELLLRQVSCSVLTIKPEGFVTPVG